MSAPLICLFQNMVQLYSNAKLQVPFNMQQETEKWQLALAWEGEEEEREGVHLLAFSF